MIKVGKDGFEISHMRYLTDSSTGLSLYLNILILKFNNIINLNFLSEKISENNLSIDVFIILLLFFLVTTFGMLISSISWAIFEIFNVEFFEKIWFKNKIPLGYHQYKNKFNDILKKLDIHYSNWHSSVIEIEEYLALKNINLSRLNVQRSFRIYLRNLAFILLVDVGILFFSEFYIYGIIVLILTFITLFISGMISFYSNASLIFKFYVVSKIVG